MSTQQTNALPQLSFDATCAAASSIATSALMPGFASSSASWTASPAVLPNVLATVSATALTQAQRIEQLPANWREIIAISLKPALRVPFLLLAATGARPCEVMLGVTLSRVSALVPGPMDHLRIDVPCAKLVEGRHGLRARRNSYGKNSTLESDHEMGRFDSAEKTSESCHFARTDAVAALPIRSLILDPSRSRLVDLLGALASLAAKPDTVTLRATQHTIRCVWEAVRARCTAQFGVSGVTLYTLRHHFAHDLAAARIPAPVRARALGHVNRKTQRYYLPPTKPSRLRTDRTDCPDDAVTHRVVLVNATLSPVHGQTKISRKATHPFHERTLGLEFVYSRPRRFGLTLGEREPRPEWPHEESRTRLLVHDAHFSWARRIAANPAHLSGSDEPPHTLGWGDAEPEYEPFALR